MERAVPLYRRLGFKEELDSLRFKKKVHQKSKLKHTEKAEAPERTRRMQKGDLETVARFDCRYFGASRLRVLRSLHEDYPQLCFISEGKPRPLGYIMARKTQEAHWIGPWISEDSEAANSLLHLCVEAMVGETELRLGMPAPNGDGVSLVRKLGFELAGKSVRMVLGKRHHSVNTAGVYGIGGPEKG